MTNETSVRLFDLVQATRKKLQPYLIIEIFPTDSQPLNDLAVDTILQGAFEDLAVTLGRLGGKAKSKAKAAASRKNGKLGGRPKKHEPPAKA